VTSSTQQPVAAEVEKELVCIFSRWLQRRRSARYARPLPLDVQGPGQSAQRQPDFILKGPGCDDVIVELKRVMQRDISLERRAERLIRSAVQEALGSEYVRRSEDYTLVPQSLSPCMPEGEGWGFLVCELRRAFAEAKCEKPYDSQGQLPFKLHRDPPRSQPFAVLTLTARSLREEVMKLLDNADCKDVPTGQLQAGTEYVLLLLSDRGSLHREDVGNWFARPTFCGWKPSRVTSIYLIDVRFINLRPCLLVNGVWPKSVCGEESIQISTRRVRRFHAYACGELHA
jgi:hypothetical protein